MQSYARCVCLFSEVYISLTDTNSARKALHKLQGINMQAVLKTQKNNRGKANPKLYFTAIDVACKASEFESLQKNIAIVLSKDEHVRMRLMTREHISFF